jgi:AcrR family transcriptional regulator
MPGQERREAIIAAAITLFSQKGFRGTTTREIAAAVGVSEPVLYQHFATKSELYAAIIEYKSLEGEEKFGHMLDSALESNDDRAFFATLATIIVRWYTEDPAYARLLLYSALEGHELSTLCYERQAKQLHEKVSEHIRRRTEQGAMREIDPLLAARAFICMIAHYSQAAVVFHSHLADCANLASDLENMIEIFLGGLNGKQKVTK